jgi:hypothetical protein
MLSAMIPESADSGLREIFLKKNCGLVARMRVLRDTLALFAAAAASMVVPDSKCESQSFEESVPSAGALRILDITSFYVS